MGQGPYGRASNWPDPGCHFLKGTIGTSYPIPYQAGSFQCWVTGPRGQNFAECDNYGSYNNVGYWGQVWPQQFATPEFQLAPLSPRDGGEIPPLRTHHRGRGRRVLPLPLIDIALIMIMIGVAVALWYYGQR